MLVLWYLDENPWSSDGLRCASINLRGNTKGVESMIRYLSEYQGGNAQSIVAHKFVSTPAISLSKQTPTETETQTRRLFSQAPVAQTTDY